MKKYKKITVEHEVYCIPERDFLNYVTKSSTQDQRDKFNIGSIYINAMVCLKCKDYIRSKHRHSYVTCKCGLVAVDGGSWYSRCIGEPKDYISVVEYFYDSEPKKQTKIK